MEKDIRRLVQSQGRDPGDFDVVGSMAPSSLASVAKYTWQPSRWGTSPFYTLQHLVKAHGHLLSNASVVEMYLNGSGLDMLIEIGNSGLDMRELWFPGDGGGAHDAG